MRLIKLHVFKTRNTSESLGKREMLWEHEPQAEHMFSISFRKHRNEKKENSLLTLIIKM